MSKQQINIKLSSIREVKFMLNVDENSDISNPLIAFGFNIHPKLDIEEVEFMCGVKYSNKQENILDCRYAFTFAVKNIREHIESTSNNTYDISDALIEQFLSIAIGTIRGVIVVKTMGTQLSQYPLPLVNAHMLLMAINKKQKEINDSH